MLSKSIWINDQIVIESIIAALYWAEVPIDESFSNIVHGLTIFNYKVFVDDLGPVNAMYRFLMIG